MKHPAISQNSRVGIIGGGQLALMLAQAAPRLGVVPVVFSQSPDDPVRARKGIEVVSDWDDFFEDVDIVTFENEFVDVRELMSLSYAGQRFCPSLAVMTRLQDKLGQKRLLGELNIPTAAFELCESSDRKSIANWRSQFKVLKWSRHGYDGKGVLVLSGQSTDDQVESFFQAAKKLGASVYAEDRIDFVSELAMVSVRATSGEIVHYPLVETIQSAGVCREITGGMRQDSKWLKCEEQARANAARLMNSLHYVGAMAIEYFLPRESDEILVNEIAPRVHNSGHATIEAANASQFENHLRAILGMPLITGMAFTHYAMLNLIGKKSETSGAPKATGEPGVFLHWYGKKETRVGRKMGHLTAVASSQDELQNRLEKMREIESKWNA